MTRALLFLLLLSPAVHAQAVRPAPAAPVPLIQQQPPSYPGLPHAPAGAGASHGGLPGAQKATLPPSPNKRLLPPTKEAGLWAADGASTASMGYTAPLFGILFQHPPENPRAAEVLDKCVAGMLDAARKAQKDRAIEALPLPVRKCMAARALSTCVSAAWSAIQVDAAQIEAEFRTYEAAAVLVARGVVHRNLQAFCLESEMGAGNWTLLGANTHSLDAVTAQWTKQQPRPNIPLKH